MKRLPRLAPLRGFLEPALARGGKTHTFEDVVNAVITGDMQLWHTKRGAAVTQIIDHPRKRVLFWFLAGGELEQVLDFQQSIRAFGRANGCEAMMLAGRKGWARALIDHGWQSSGVVMEAAL